MNRLNNNHPVNLIKDMFCLTGVFNIIQMKIRILFTLVLISSNIWGQSQPRKVLFIGNSYILNNNLPQITANIASSMGDQLDFSTSSIWSYSLKEHCANSTTLSDIRQGGWNYVILQEFSQNPSESLSWVETNVYPYAQYLDNEINLYNPGAETMFYMTWGRKDGDAERCARLPEVCTYIGMDNLTRERYMYMAQTNHAVVSPVGAVWRYIRENYPSIELYEPDGSHPSQAGSYAAACCFYTAIFRKDPGLITYNYTINPDDASKIRIAAKQVVYNNLLTWHIGEYDNHTITASSETGGTINPNGNLVISSGATISFSISPNIGYHISDVIVDNVSHGPISTFTFTNVISNHTISATYTSAATYTIASSAGTGGSINPAGSVVLNEGINQTYIITPALGYRIADVKADDVSAGVVSRYTFSNVTANHTIAASFEITPIYTITAEAGMGGSVTPNGVTTVNEGTSQTYTITPAAGYRIANILADGILAGAVSTYTFSNIFSNHTISVTFSIITYTLTSSAGAEVSISPAGSVTVNHGGSQTYIISRNTGYQISNVLVDNVSVGTPASFTFNNITASHTISVVYSLITNTITASAGTGGSISPQGNVSVNYGSNLTFSISAGTGYYISDVKADNVSEGAITTYTFNNVKAGHTISASFTQFTYTITGSAGTGGSINPSGNTTVNYGSAATFAITPDFGFKVADVRIDNVSVGAVSEFTFRNVTEDHLISATFATATYTLTASAGNGGTVSPSGTTTVTHGTSRTYPIIPGTGYRISDVKVDNISVGNVTTYTFSDITSNHSISATFAILTFNLAVTTGNGGTVSPGGDITAEYGTSRAFTITPNTGYYVSDVKADNVSIGPVSSYTFANVTGNHSISAEFSLFTFSINCSAGTGGSITPAGASIINYGSGSTYLINPSVGFRILDVTVDNVSQGAITSYTFRNVTSNHSISAAFTSLTYNITCNPGKGGSISPQEITTVIYGTDKTYSFTADIGFQVEDVMVDNKSIGPVSEYTFTNIKEDHSISASFSVITYAITAEANSGGSVSLREKTVVNYGTDLNCTFTPDFGYRISDVKIDNIPSASVPSYSFTNITDDHHISVIFKLIETYTITSSPGMGGSISPSESVTLFEGSDQAYLITPENDFRILDVIVDNHSLGALNEFTFSNIISSHSISAMFTTSIDANVYPNPFIDKFNIHIASPDGYLFDISVVDINGKITYSQSEVPGNITIPVNLQVSRGIYFLRLYLKAIVR